MALNIGKHVVEDFEGTRCTLIEKGISPERAKFLKDILELNGYEVKIITDQETGTSKLGVSDLLFNPIIDIYERRLKSQTGKKITPSFWLQLSTQESENEVNYWH
jgi:hypothetical protein